LLQQIEDREAGRSWGSTGCDATNDDTSSSVQETGEKSDIHKLLNHNDGEAFEEVNIGVGHLLVGRVCGA